MKTGKNFVEKGDVMEVDLDDVNNTDVNHPCIKQMLDRLKHVIEFGQSK